MVVGSIPGNLAAPPDPLDNRPVDEQNQPSAPPPDRPALGARGEDLTHIVTAFALVFVAGFALVVFVLMSRRRK